MLNNVPIARKLALLCAVFLIPVVLLAWLLLDRSNKAIDFAESELDGISYISSILDLSDPFIRSHWEAQLSGSQLSGTAIATIKKAETSISDAERTFGTVMRSASQAADLHQSLSDYLSKATPPLPNQHLGVLTSANGLTSRIGDHSNLILDPDLDSYYVMDMAVLRLPALVSSLEDATSQLWTMRAATPSQYQHFLDLLSAARSTLAAMNNGVALAAENNPSGQINSQLRPSLNGMNEKVTAYTRSLELAARMVQGGLDFDRADVVSTHAAMQEALFQSWRDGLSQLASLLGARIEKLKFELWASLAASTLALILAGVLATAIARGISRPLRDLQSQMARLASGETNMVISARNRQDEVGHMAEALEVFRENAVRTQRMKAALDCVGTPVLVASSEGVLTDLNHAARQHFQTHGPDIRSEVADFDIQNALGHPLASTFQTEALKTVLSVNANGPQRGQITLGSRTFDVRANVVISERDERLGIVSEWIDISERLRMEAGIARLVEAGIAGDFSQRLDVEDQRGFLRTLAERMNEFIDTVSDSLAELVEVNADLAQGDLMRRIERPYEGAFQALADNTNQMADRLADIVRKIAEAAHAVHNASGEIAQGSEDLATRTEQQAANLGHVDKLRTHNLAATI